ncbi:unnamed protein product [Bursaphelenchus okinawaensis]|uniref:Catalase core domain-containing protein n=1 Tax=Bursaphelenchus okinawaensis TaxID=465554 RepID=A0A811LTJ2_9BILA|nr:unnamed protein product [Bursaphelenchus okinawaensis]CAG9128663.1 unnamed protein product [Bursaphelenchus okinawaensis]
MKDHAANQMNTYAEETKERLTTSYSVSIPTHTASLTVGERGPILLQDHFLIDELQRFARERNPERVVHAKGAGAHGVFEVTHDITQYSKACVFSAIGKKTPLFIRFSTVGGERGSADTARDPRGFAVKFYTDDGIWDLVGNNTPIFFINDAMSFPSFIHTQKRNPATNLKDPNMMFDFISLRPECLHQTLFSFSDRGTPDGYRYMNGYGSHTYKMINDKNEGFWVKFHLKSAQGIKNLSAKRAAELAGKDPDYATRDLYNAIVEKEYPSWNFNIQVMPDADADKCPFNPFDMTKVWPQGDFPLIPVGRITLNRNPKNYYAEVEQSAFAPSHIIPGIDFSPDKMLQGRILAYPDTHYHRLGPNFMQLPINCPLKRPENYQRDGSMCNYENGGGAPNYYPNSFGANPEPENKMKEDVYQFNLSGAAHRWENPNDDYYRQPKVFWEKILNEDHRDRVCQNLVEMLQQCAPHVQERCIKEFRNVSPNLGNQLRHMLCEISEKNGEDEMRENKRRTS